MGIQRHMKPLNERIVDVSSHLQTLASPEYSAQVQNAVEKKDRDLLVKICRKAKIPAIYLAPVVSVVLSVSPNQKWPDFV